jgi:hypothetical protein
VRWKDQSLSGSYGQKDSKLLLKSQYRNVAALLCCLYPAVLSDQMLQYKYGSPYQHNILLLLVHVNIIIIKISGLQHMFRPVYESFSSILWIKDISVVVYCTYIKHVVRMIIVTIIIFTCNNNNNNKFYADKETYRLLLFMYFLVEFLVLCTKTCNRK